MTCNELSERIVDYLYDELPSAERAALDAHLAGCPRCRQEVEGLGQARRSARQALLGPLAEAPPPRVRQAVLEAARSAAGRGEPARATVLGPGLDEASAWKRLWSWVRRPWFAPAFVTVSAMVIFLVARGPLLDRPGRVLDQAMQAPAPEEPAMAPESTASDQSVESAESEATGQAGLPEGRVMDDARAVSPPLEAGRAGRTGEGKRVVGLRGAKSGAGEASGFAQPPPARRKLEKTRAPARQKSAAPAAAPSIAPAPSARKRVELPRAPRPAPNYLLEAAEPATAPAAGARAAGLAAAEREEAEPQADLAVARRLAARGAPAAEDEDEAGDGAERAESIPRLVKRAESLFGAGRFVEAARIYASLLRHHPKHPDVGQWKKRRAAAEAAAKP